MPGIGARAWEYLEPGEPIAGLTITKRLIDGPTQATTRYAVVLSCCNVAREVSHESIRKRNTKGNVECALCTRRRLAREMGAGNKGGSWLVKRALKQAERAGKITIESGPWAGSYGLLSPNGDRFGGRPAATNKGAGG